jgi:hypothetical protein
LLHILQQLVGEAADDSLAIWPTDARDQDFLDDDHYHLYLGKRLQSMAWGCRWSSPKPGPPLPSASGSMAAEQDL